MIKLLKPDIETLKDTFHMGYDLYEDSRKEANEVWDLYHNRQWTTDQQSVLENRGQPKETFNIVKLFARTLVGYYSTVANTSKARPRQESDVTIATLATDLIQATYEANDFDIEGDKLKLSAIVSGIAIAEIHPYFTGKRDEFNRPIYDIKMRNVADYECVLDPLSTDENYEDARWLHRYKWVPAETIIKMFGKAAAEKLEAYDNHLETVESEFEFKYNTLYQGRYRIFDNFLLVHSTLVDSSGKRWSIYWCGDEILEKKEITYKNVKWPYRVVRTHTSDKAEFYGIFREVIETQKAINQAIVKLQLMVNTQKAFVEESAVKNLADFTSAFNRVTGVVPVKALKGIKIETLGREALEQYQIIDKAFDRVQRILGINDSFLGQAFASDSGRKVKLQQNATMMSLRYLTTRIESMYKHLSKDILALANQYYYAHRALRLTDEITGDRFIQINKPMQVFTGQLDEQQQPIMQTMYEQVYDVENQKPLEDEEGNLVFAPIPEEETEIRFDELDMTIETTSYNDEDEKSQLLIESVLSGNVGSMLSQVNPAGFFKMAGLSIRSMKTKYSPEMSRILEETGQLLQQNPVAEEEAQFAGQGSNQQTPLSRSLKLPQNTNEVASDVK